MSKQQLTELLIKDQKPYHQKSLLWFNRYNHVIDVYHNIVHSSKQKLEKLSCPYRSFIFLSYFINNYLLNIAMVLAFTFLPIFNVALLLLVISYTLFLKNQTQKHKRNLLKVQDPFETFYFYPQMCSQLQKHFTTLNLTVEEIENFSFNETHEKIRHNLLSHQDEQQQKSGQNIQKNKKMVKVPIYDQYFYDSFFLVRKEYYKSISWSILGIFLISLDILFYYAIFYDFIFS